MVEQLSIHLLLRFYVVSQCCIDPTPLSPRGGADQHTYSAFLAKRPHNPKRCTPKKIRRWGAFKRKLSSLFVHRWLAHVLLVGDCCPSAHKCCFCPSASLPRRCRCAPHSVIPLTVNFGECGKVPSPCNGAALGEWQKENGELHWGVHIRGGHPGPPYNRPPPPLTFERRESWVGLETLTETTFWGPEIEPQVHCNKGQWEHAWKTWVASSATRGHRSAPVK